MDIEKAKDILLNVIADEVIGTYCIEIQKEVDCSKNCENEDCYLIQAIDTVLSELERLQNNEEILNGELARIGIETLGLEKGSSTDDIITEIKNKYRIIELMAKEIEFRTGNCPYGTYNYDLDCKKRCNNNYKECWIEYFTKKVEGK